MIDIGKVNDYKCIHIRIILPNVTSYVMASKTKKYDMSGCFFFYRKS